ncbi:hypothetical protein DER71_12225 [Halanaerobium sp. DL-01]|uniref:hypothetical protein n=1 Tax=Halanaerobium sp. DL-01 TaxID=1653064 RepID=UPI000DF4B7F3|nr:hypothetical protein [Halanaerobium sp. DL-01]RCW81796.1 hypothetical protein DER71_12225 [Halanaerobium sp. DL-01]
MHLHSFFNIVPGTYNGTYKIITKTGANVISVTHDRLTPDISLKHAQVQITLETKNEDHVKDIMDTLENNNYRVKRIR